MSEELDEEQLLEFCQRLGLAEDGYLDEKDLSVVYNCIGLNAPAEVISCTIMNNRKYFKN